MSSGKINNSKSMRVSTCTRMVKGYASGWACGELVDWLGEGLT